MTTTLLLTAALLLTQTPAPTPTTPAAAPKPPTLSELHEARREAHVAKVRAHQLEILLRERALAEERATLEAAITAAHPGWRPDWNQGGVLVAAPATKDKETPR